MAIKKINVQIIRTDDYTIEFDDEVFTEDFLKEWSSVFHEVENLEELAKAVAFQQMRFGNGFKEGFGHVTIDGKKYYPNEYENFAKGINIVINSEDNDFDYITKEVK